ncbi:MAG TPA: GNAT family N-acetyltransferase [Thermoplasmata archaeon]|nr:GNAT family N-acetyltransferase [Thermoplasmata archaeon]
MHIRPAERSDLEAIVAIYNHYVETSPATFEIARVSPEDRAVWLAEHSRPSPHRAFVAEADGGLLGWATSSPFRPRAAYGTTVEVSVYCHPLHRGERVGSRLYGALFHAIEGEDLERAVAGITLPNPGSVALHRRWGFRWVGTFTRVGRKFGRYWDVAWFERPMRSAEPGPSLSSERGSTDLASPGLGRDVSGAGAK